LSLDVEEEEKRNSFFGGSEWVDTIERVENPGLGEAMPRARNVGCGMPAK